MIKLENISFYYEDDGLFDKFKKNKNSKRKILDNINLSLASKQSIGVLGLSGSGKSTLAKIIAGIYKAKSGKIHFNNGLDFEDVQIVFQDAKASFNPNFTVKEGILEALYDTKEKDLKIKHLFSRVNLDMSLLDRKCSMLSGGMLQRLSIARAIAKNPKIIILDEATSSLDVIIQAQILKMLKSLQNEFSYIVITHDLRIVKLFCDEVIVLDSGVIVEHQKVTNTLELKSDIGKKLSNAILPPYPKDYL